MTTIGRLPRFLSLLMLTLAACTGPTPTAAPSPSLTPPSSLTAHPSPSPTSLLRATATVAPLLPTPSPQATPSPTVPPLTGPLPPPVTAALDHARALLPEDRPPASATDLTDALATAIGAFLDQVPDPNQPLSAQPEVLSRLQVELVELRLRYPRAVNLVAADLDDRPGEELVVTIGHPGLRAWAFRRTPSGYQVLPLPAVAPWPTSDAAPALRQAGDLTGDGHTEVLVEYTTLGGTARILDPIITRWNGQTFDVLFTATVSQWTDPPPTEWRLVARDDGLGFDVELVYPVFGVHDHKHLNHARGRQRWRWNPESGRYILLSETVEELSTLRHLVNLAEAHFLAEDYAGALPLYRRVLTDTTLALAPGAGIPAEDEPDWQGYAHFRLGETYALLGDEAAAREELTLAWQAGGAIASLAGAFLSHYTGEDSLPAALAATWDVSISGGVYVNALAVWSPGTAVTAYLDRHAGVLATGSVGPVTALRAAGVPVADGLVADLDGDGRTEFVFITWHKLGASPYHHAWLAWQEAGYWRARQIDEAKSLALVGVEELRIKPGRVLLTVRSLNGTSRLDRWLWDGSRLGWIDPRTGQVHWPSPWPQVGGLPTWEY